MIPGLPMMGAFRVGMILLIVVMGAALYALWHERKRLALERDTWAANAAAQAEKALRERQWRLHAETAIAAAKRKEARIRHANNKFRRQLAELPVSKTGECTVLGARLRPDTAVRLHELARSTGVVLVPDAAHHPDSPGDGKPATTRGLDRKKPAGVGG